MLAFRPLLSIENLFGRPAFAQSRVNCGMANAGFSLPFIHRQGFPIEGNEAISACISTLFRLGGPAAIPRLVIASILDSIESMLWRWGWPHIGKERSKRVSPAFTDDDSSTAVTRVIRHRRVETSTDHRIPSAPFLGALAHSCLAMLIIPMCQHDGIVTERKG